MTVRDVQHPAVVIVWPAETPAPALQPPLGRREAQILAYVATGHTNSEIGKRLRLSPDTVKTYLSRACRKLGAGNRAHAVALGIRGGVIDLGAATNPT